MEKNIWKSFELRIIAIILFIILALSVSFYLLIYNQYHNLTTDSLKEDAQIVHQYVEEIINEDSFTELNTIEDEQKEIYTVTHKQLDEVRRIANIRYLYTAKQNAAGEYIYVLDGLDPNAEDFRHVGDPIEDEIIPELKRCLDGETFFDDDIMATEWGIVYVTYFPVHASDGSVLGAIGMEFDCESLYNSYNRVKTLTVIIAVALAAVLITVAIVFLKRIVNNTEAILRKKDELLIEAREEALKNSQSKSDFLSRMSHEMRTPMNAIIGMTAIAETTDDMNKIRYCLSTIGTSSALLLNLINDVLDMSKIEAGKFELELAPFNLEKMLMKVSNLIVDKAEEKHQKFDVLISNSIGVHYIGDEMRISQIISNLLSNAVKFTPDGGSVSISAEVVGEEKNFSVLRFTVKDTGIGMTEEQMSKLFKSFEQADGSISRKFGGTGLGLAICKTLAEKMGGRIWLESEIDVGSVFYCEIKLKRAPEQDNSVIFGGIAPSDLNILMADRDDGIRNHFVKIMEHFGINPNVTDSGESVICLAQKARASGKVYDVIFLDSSLPDKNGIEIVGELNGIIDKNTVVINTSFLEWHTIESDFNALGVERFISKPLFPSSVLDVINDVIGSNAKKLDIASPQAQESADFSDSTVLLVEDIEINRVIVSALLEATHINIDVAENGLMAVQKFKESPDKYDMIFMDVQMPEMDGLEATKTIRALGTPESQTIPIIAMTANAFKEDIDRCKAAGMNDHIPKPIDRSLVIEKMKQYIGK